MSEYLKKPEESRTIADRRAFPRIQVRSLAYIELDDGNGGLILNISEGGIAVQAAELLVGDSFGSMRFRLPKTQNWIQTAGKIAWQGRSRKEAGVKFIDLPGDTQRQIHDWIYSAAFSPNLLTEKGRFKILWEAESSKPETAIRESAAIDVPSEFDAIFPSEQSLPLAPVLNAPATSSSNAAEACSQEEFASGYPEPLADETGTKNSLGGVENELSGARRIAIAPGEPPRSISVVGRTHEILPQTEAKDLPDESPLLPRSSAEVRRYDNPFAPIDAPANPASLKREYGTPFSEYNGEEVADAQPRSRKTHLLTGVLCFAAGLVLALLIVTGPSELKNRFFQFYKVTLAPFVGVHNPSPESAPPSPSAPVPPKVADNSTQLPGAAPVTPGTPQQETSPAPKSNAAAANAPAEQTGQGSVNAPGSAESSALRPSPTSEPAAVPEKQHSGENELTSPKPASPANQVLASPSRENPPQSEPTLDAYAQPTQNAPVSQAVNEPPPVENEQAPAATQPPLPLSAPREPEIPVGTAAISSRFHSVRNAPVSDPEAPAPILRIGQLTSIRQPVYPPEAAKRRIEGAVKLRAAVAQNGVVESVELVSGPPGLVAAAIDAVRDWRYAPTLLDERPVETLEDITVVFHLANSTPSPR